MTNQVHKFEAAGLGQAPYRFIGCNEKVFIIPGQPAKAGSCCDYCYQGIRYEYWFCAADGKKFKVGCDCFYSASNAEAKAEVKQVERAEKTMMRQIKINRDAARITFAKDKLASDVLLLTNQPHPSFSGKTMRDYAEWMMKNAGIAGKLKVCKIVEHV